MERKGISKSAPTVRRKGPSKNDKSSTIKEINKWISKGYNDHFSRTCSRGISSLTENVTEERMLYSRQLDLGRERYKFLTNHAYEKQKFVERQQIKDKMMKQFMASARKVIEKTYSEKPKRTLTIKIPQMDDNSVRSSPIIEEQATRIDSRISRVSSKAEKKAEFSNDVSRVEQSPSRDSKVLNKYALRSSLKTPTKKKMNGNKDLKSASKSAFGESDTIKNKHIDSAVADRTNALSRGFYVNTSNIAEKDFQTDDIRKGTRLPSVLVSDNQRSGRNKQSAVCERARSTSPSKTVRYAGLPEGPRKSVIYSEPSTPKWAQSPRAFKSFGEKFDTSVDDPRYVALTNTLMTVDDIKIPKLGVKEIIEKNEVFRRVSKSEDAAHAKQMHAKFIALLLENEFK